VSGGFFLRSFILSGFAFGFVRGAELGGFSFFSFELFELVRGVFLAQFTLLGGLGLRRWQ